jgi:prevent-host-death family protein
MKKRKAFKYTPPDSGTADTLKETAVLDPLPAREVNVRAAKDNFSSLLEEASRGHEIIITSDGKPKAKLVPYHMKRKRFKVDWALLRSMPVTTGPTAADIIREERDGRS